MAWRKGLRLVEVEWVDSASRDEWHDIENARALDLYQVRSVGYLLWRDKVKVVIAQGHSDYEQVFASLTIPTVCVTKVRRLHA